MYVVHGFLSLQTSDAIRGRQPSAADLSFERGPATPCCCVCAVSEPPFVRFAVCVCESVCVSCLRPVLLWDGQQVSSSMLTTRQVCAPRVVVRSGRAGWRSPALLSEILAAKEAQASQRALARHSLIVLLYNIGCILFFSPAPRGGKHVSCWSLFARCLLFPGRKKEVHFCAFSMWSSDSINYVRVCGPHLADHPCRSGRCLSWAFAVLVLPPCDVHLFIFPGRPRLLMCLRQIGPGVLLAPCLFFYIFFAILLPRACG